MKNVTIKKLSLELKDDYLDFFDNRAFLIIIPMDLVIVLRRIKMKKL